MIRTTLISITLTALALMVATPAFAQDDHHKGHDKDHQEHNHDSHDHQDHKQENHHDMNHHNDTIKATVDKDKTITLATNDKILAGLDAGGSPVVAKVLGVVCDFCAKAMDKTFGKREEVAAVYVDLDTKTLNLIVAAGQTIDDETISKLVKRSGYKVDKIYREEYVVIGGTDEADPS